MNQIDILSVWVVGVTVWGFYMVIKQRRVNKEVYSKFRVMDDNLGCMYNSIGVNKKKHDLHNKKRSSK